MSAYGSSYGPWSKGSASYLPRNTSTSASHSASSSFDRSRPNYGSLPRSYGSSKTTTDRNANHAAETVVPPTPTRTASSRFATRGLSVERSSDCAKSPEPRKYAPLETTSLRIGSSSRFGGQIARSPISEKTPNVFGISPVSELPPSPFGRTAPSRNESCQVVSRSTSPTPPCNSSFLRAKRAEMERLETKQVARTVGKTCVSTEVQTEDMKKVPAWGTRVGSSGSTATTASRPMYRGYLAPTKKSIEEVKPEEPAKPRIGGLSLAARPTELSLPKTNFTPFKLSKSASSTGKPPPPKVSVNPPPKQADSSSSDDSSSESSSESESESSSSSKTRPPSTGSGFSKYVSAPASHASTSHMSSADEASSLAADKPPKAPFKKDEAKAVVVKALAPVTPFKVKYGNSGKSSEEEEKKTFKLRKFDSGERAWWLESTKDVPGVLSKSPSPATAPEETKQASRAFKLRKFDSGDTSSWLSTKDESDKQAGVKLQNMPNGVNLKSSTSSVSSLQKTGSVSSLTSDDGSSNKSLQRTKSSVSMSLSKKGSGGLQKTGSSLSVAPPSPIKRSPSGLNAAAAKPPPSTPRTDSLELLQAKEHTPGFNRLHQRLRCMRPLVRVESGERDWWLSDEEKAEANRKIRPSEQLGRVYCGTYTNIDQVLGNQAPPPASFRTPENSSSESSSDEDDQDWYREIAAHQVKIHDSTAQSPVMQPAGMIKLDDTALQLYKDGDYGAYLDLDASINEQHEEFDAFNADRKNSIVLRTQLSVRVHTIIEKLLNSEGRELRRALFSLKQIFQEDKDLVHEFVQNDGLACLIKVGSDADQNYQNYILRALGQVMLYVDGMNGVIEHPATIQWLYNLVSSKFRLVVKTALKLLLVFVEYADSNCVLLVKAIKAVDYVHTTKPWSNVLKLMKEYDAADTELLIYAMTLINKTLNGLPDQDVYYDQVDAIEELGIENIIRRYMSKQGTDLDLLRQFQIYEAVLQYEDGLEKGTPLRQLDETIRKALKNRKSLTPTINPDERRKSRRFSTGNSPLTLTLTPTRAITPPHSPDILNNLNDSTGVGVTPGLRRRRERTERQISFIREQREVNLVRLNSSSSVSSVGDNLSSSDDGNNNEVMELDINKNCTNNSGHVTLELTPTAKGVNGLSDDEILDGKSLRREGTVKDLTQKIANSLGSPNDENKNVSFSDMRGIISKAKEELAKSQSRGALGGGPLSPTSPPGGGLSLSLPVEIKKSETELHWESLQENSTRPLVLCDLDFNDMGSDEEKDILAPAGYTGGIPPPPPPGPPGMLGGPPAQPPALLPLAPNPPPVFFKAPSPSSNPTNNATLGTNKKTKKTVKLFWKEVRDDPIVMSKMGPRSLIWDELSPVVIDTQKLEHLFESRAKDLISKKQQEMNKNKEIIVLDHKRSNAINIGMTKLPPPRSIKTAILKMDATVMNREGIEKLLTMLPTEEERSKIQEAQAANPDLPLGSAEQFLLTLASISELQARLKLWAFKLDYENLEREIAEPLMDLKQGMECLRSNKTFRAILGTLLSIGIFLNGSEVKGFQIDYLSKVPEVKDTVHKHTLLHHLCHVVMEKFPDATDLYSEIGAITRASKVDFEELASNIVKMEQECKASFDYLKDISKHDGTTNMKLKMSDFLADCAERIIVLDKVHRRVQHRFHKFCLWIGIPLHRVNSTRPNELCRIVSEFALEYRTTRERVLQQLEKKASHRERNKTRGKMITEVGKLKTQEDRKDAELKQLLGHKADAKDSVINGGSLPWRRTRKMNGNSPGVNGSFTDGDDEILESLVKTATKTPVSRTTPRDRKRTRNADLRRTLRNGLTDEDRKHLAAYIKGY